MNETQTRKLLAGLPNDRREKLRRICLVSTESDLAIAEEVKCTPMHVHAMRQRLIALGVLVKPALLTPPPPRKATAKPSKYRNGDLFDE